MFSLITAPIWTTLLVVAGYALQQRFPAIDHWLNPVTDGFAALCGLLLCRAGGSAGADGAASGARPPRRVVST